MIEIIDETGIRLQLTDELQYAREVPIDIVPLSKQSVRVVTNKGSYRIFLRANDDRSICYKNRVVLKGMKCCKCSGYIFFTEHNNIGINSYQLHLKCACSKGYLIVDLAKVIPTVVKSTWGVDVQSLGRLHRVTS